MKVLTAVLLLALAIGIAPAFASEVSAADQTTNSLAVEEKNESKNISDLNTATEPDATVNVENSTIAEPTTADTTGVTVIQNESNSTEIGTDANSSKESGNSRELTTKEMKSIKAQGVGDEIKKWGRYAWDQLSAAGRYITDHMEHYTKIFQGNVSAGGSNGTWSLNASASIFGR